MICLTFFETFSVIAQYILNEMFLTKHKIVLVQYPTYSLESDFIPLTEILFFG